MTTTQMYWLVMLDNIKEGLAAILVICGLFCALGIPMLGMIGKEELFPLIARRILVIAATVFLICIFIPSTKQMAAILVVPKIANSEKVQTIGNKVYDLAVEWMEELKPNKQGSEVK